MIEQVEEFRPELDLLILFDREPFQNCEILADKVRTDKSVAPDIANTSCSRKGKDCGIEGVVWIAHIGGHSAHARLEIDTVRKLVQPAEVRIQARENREREPAPVAGYTRDSPRSHQLAKKSMRASKHRVIGPKGQLIHPRGNDAVAHVEGRQAIV